MKNRYKKLFVTGLTFTGTCLSLVACNMGSNDNGVSPKNDSSNAKKFEEAVITENKAILADIVAKLTTQKNQFITSYKSDISYWTPRCTIDQNPGKWNIVNATYWGEKDNLIYGIGYAHFGYVQWYNGLHWEYTMPIFLAFDESKNMLYSSENSGFNNPNSELLNGSYGAAFEFDFSPTGFLMPYLKDSSLSDGHIFFNNDKESNVWGSPQLWAAGYPDIIQILPNVDNGKLSIGKYQNRTSFLNASIRISAYRYGDSSSAIGSLEGKRHFESFLITLTHNDKTGAIDVKINGQIW
ncbi:hypothetical protein JTY60_02170 [symbiont of Argiope bruennichi]|uniref:hypothetical protein n=1 Tax=symbiont of Argiope bruennichi TaxID=2810479 RepID=UPI003DA68800